MDFLDKIVNLLKTDNNFNEILELYFCDKTDCNNLINDDDVNVKNSLYILALEYLSKKLQTELQGTEKEKMIYFLQLFHKKA